SLLHLKSGSNLVLWHLMLVDARFEMRLRQLGHNGDQICGANDCLRALCDQRCPTGASLAKTGASVSRSRICTARNATVFNEANVSQFPAGKVEAVQLYSAKA